MNQSNSKSTQITIRIPHELQRRLKDEAIRRHEGYEAQTVREAIRVYLDLRETMGAQFEPMLETFTRRPVSVPS